MYDFKTKLLRVQSSLKPKKFKGGHTKCITLNFKATRSMERAQNINDLHTLVDFIILLAPLIALYCYAQKVAHKKKYFVAY